MNKLRHFWAILALVAPLAATKVHAQSFGAPIDLIAPVQEDIIRDLEQNGSSKKPSPVQYRPSYSPDFIKALQECDNEEISGHISAQRVTEDVDFTHPLLLRRARECGAISSVGSSKPIFRCSCQHYLKHTNSCNWWLLNFYSLLS